MFEYNRSIVASDQPPEALSGITLFDHSLSV